MTRGGLRAGAGRKVGALTKRSIEIAQKAAEQGILPAEVGLNEMKVWADLAKSLDEPFRDLLDIMRKDLKRGVIDPEVFRALHQLSAIRQMAITSALNMAPYFHPRMGALAVHEPVSSLPMERLDK